jgi:protein SERAC1
MHRKLTSSSRTTTSVCKPSTYSACTLNYSGYHLGCKLLPQQVSRLPLDNNIFATISANSGCADVIFVHGLTGSPLDTWSSERTIEQEGTYWPKWLVADLPHLNYYTLGYPASLFAKWAKKEMNLYERAKSVLEVLAAYNFGNRPLVFICHSLGGLLVKQILRTALDSTDEAWHGIANNCCGVIFIATPHSGSSVADLLKTFSGCFSSVHVEKLKQDASDLDELNGNFRTFCQTRNVQVTAFYEKHKTYKLASIVDARSADPGVNGCIPLPVDADHVNICKPEHRHSPIYLSIQRRLKNLLPAATAIESDDPFFEEDELALESSTDRRDLFEKMAAAGREHEYLFANESQNRFARAFVKNGLKTASANLYNNLLADIEQRFQSLVYHPLICAGADTATILNAVQVQVVDPISTKYADSNVTAKTIMNAIYFLTERCHIRWDKP